MSWAIQQVSIKGSKSYKVFSDCSGIKRETNNNQISGKKPPNTWTLNDTSPSNSWTEGTLTGKLGNILPKIQQKSYILKCEQSS